MVPATAARPEVTAYISAAEIRATRCARFLEMQDSLSAAGVTRLLPMTAESTVPSYDKNLSTHQVDTAHSCRLGAPIQGMRVNFEFGYASAMDTARWSGAHAATVNVGIAA